MLCYELKFSIIYQALKREILLSKYGRLNDIKNDILRTASIIYNQSEIERLKGV